MSAAGLVPGVAVEMSSPSSYPRQPPPAAPLAPRAPEEFKPAQPINMSDQEVAKKFPHRVAINDRSNKNLHKLAALLGPTAATPNATPAEMRASKEGGGKTPLSHYDGIDTAKDEDQDFTGYVVIRAPHSAADDWEHEDVADVDIHVGDIVEVEEGMTVPCDLVLLSVSDDSPTDAFGQHVILVDTMQYDEFTQKKKQLPPEGNPWGSKKEALTKIRGEVLCTESDADLFGFEGVLSISQIEDDVHVNKETAVPWDKIELDIKKHFLPRGCKIFQGTCCGLAIFVGPDCTVSKFKLAEHKKAAKIQAIKNRGARTRVVPPVPVAAQSQPSGLTEAEKIAIQEAGADDYDTIASKRDRRLSAQRQRTMLACVFCVLTVLLTAGVVFAMWYAVEASKPPPPPPVSAPTFGTVSPWSLTGKGVAQAGDSWGNLAVVAKNNSAMLYFDEPSEQGGTTIIDYTIYAEKDGTQLLSTWTKLGSPALIDSLDNNAQYRFKLVARNKMGLSDESMWSPFVTPHDVVRQALYDIYTDTGGASEWHANYRTDGPGTLSWANILQYSSSNVDFCKFRGLACDGNDLVSIEVTGEGPSHMAGTLPGTIGNLETLKELNFFNNQLTGTIPSSIGNLRELTTLYLNDNSFSGKVPDELAACTNVRRFNIKKNSLTHMSDLLDGILRRSAGNENNCEVDQNPWVCPIPDIAVTNCAIYPPVACTPAPTSPSPSGRRVDF